MFSFDSVVVKIASIFLAFIFVRKQLSFQDVRQAPLFYALMPLLEILKFFFLNSNFSQGHLISFMVGICYWSMCLLAFMIIRKRVTIDNIDTIDYTLTAFFVINVIVSFGDLIFVMYQSGSINPYNLYDEAYGSSTGDFIKGVMRGPSFLNMCVCSFFAIYFLFKERYLYSFLGVVIAILTSSNFANFIFLPILLTLLFVLKGKKARVTILLQLLAFVVFYIFMSKGNRDYIFSTFSPKKDVTTDVAANIIKASPITNDTANKKNLDITSKAEILLNSANMGIIPFEYTYGKKVAFEETYHYLLSSPTRFLFGAGMGNFSSQLACRTADLPMKKSRLFQMLPIYVSQDFYDNHYRIFYQLYRLPPAYHSIKHTPNSFWNQIFGEYGTVGFLLFVVFYVWYFLRKGRKMTYAWGMVFLIGGFLFVDYLFEYLSVVVFFELFFLIDIKRAEKQIDEAR